MKANMIGETEWIDESSNLSMQSAEFCELPLVKLDVDRSQASLDSELDRSKGGLNLAVSNVLKVGSNSSCSTVSQKRFRCPIDQSLSAAKRSKKCAVGRAPGSSSSSSGFQNKKKAPLNFADILKSTQERNTKKREDDSRFNVPPSMNTGKEGVPESGNTFSNSGAIWAGSYGGQASWVQRCFPSTAETRKGSIFPTQISAIQPMDLKGNAHKAAERPGATPQSQNNIKFKSHKEDDSKVSLQAPEDDKIIYRRESICSDEKSPIKLEPQKGNKMVIKDESLISTHVWQMPLQTRIIIANSQSSPDCLAWGASRQSIASNLISNSETNDKCSLIKPVPEPDTIVSAISPSSTTSALSHGTESMSTEVTPTTSAMLTQGTHDSSNSRTTPTPSLSLTDAIQIPLPSRVSNPLGGKQFSKQQPGRKPAIGPLSLRPIPITEKPNAGKIYKGRSVGKRSHFKKPSGKVILTEHRISKRIRQLSIAKKTAGYLNYLRHVPRDKRGPTDPRTPDATERISKRRFDGKVRVWRRRLHEWDEPIRTSQLDVKK